MSKKVFVGMSGGVDSSVTAALLKKAGFDVTGVFIKVWSPDWLPCTWKDERRDAMRVAAHLDIPFLTFDFEEEYKTSVVDYMIDEYKKGRTPNPDVMCNKEVKFGSFLKKSLEMGADYIATGHYARISPEEMLMEGIDQSKDQSYFLWTIPKKNLKHILFPIGKYQKSEVRELARTFSLPTAEKKDSQGICFIGKVDMKEFLQHYIEYKTGDVINETGEVIGSHEGAVFYTIGQRHGFSLTKKSATDTPYYIIKKDVEANTITVSQKIEEDSLKTIHQIVLSQVVIREDLEITKKYGARIRYRQEKQACRVLKHEADEVELEFDTPLQGVSLGQSVVLYDGPVCIGGGIIEKVG